MNFGEHALVQRIKERFCAPEFATLANVQTPSGTFADAVAVNLWRSRGYEVVGFEVKSARSDWLRELRDPKKAEGCAQYCNTFWIVANENVVKIEELPLGWGLYEPQAKGLIQRRKASAIEHHRALTVPFMVSLIRRAVEKGDMTQELSAAREAACQAGIEEGIRRSESHEDKSAREKLAHFEKLHAEFKERTGIEIRDWMGSKELAEVYQLARKMEQVERSLTFARETLNRNSKDLTETLRRLAEARNG